MDLGKLAMVQLRRGKLVIWDNTILGKWNNDDLARHREPTTRSK